MRTRRYRLRLRLAGLPLLCLAACAREPALPEAGPFPDAPIVLISIDTLRSDRLPAYGYTRVETPAIDRLRRDGVLFERAYSHVPLTLPSHASILTGLLPAHHGVRDNVGYRLQTDAVPYLPKLLRAAGYRTGAAVSSFVLRADAGLAEGFDLYESAIDVRANEALGNAQRSGGQTLLAATPWLESVAAGRFFLFLHFYEPHTPHQPPPPFAGRYPGRPYDGEVAAADAVVGELLATLDRLGLYQRSIVMLLSDHGEGLFDHGEMEHGIFLYREALQVPLLLKLPGAAAAGASVAAPAQLADVTPTLLRLAGLEPPARTDGVSLLDLARSDPPARKIFAETFYARLHLGWSELFSIIDERFQFISAPESELYDLAADPAEKRNVLATERRAFVALRDALASFDTSLAPPAEEDAETRRQLAALGYLGNQAKPTEGPLPDPKNKIGSLRPLFEGIQQVADGRYTEAIDNLRRVVGENPGMVDAWESLAQAYQGLGRLEEAHAAYRQAMESSGGASHVAVATGNILFEMGRIEEAADHARLGLEANPVGALDLLAQIALTREDFGDAEKHARAALEAAGGPRIGPLVTLAQVQQKQGKLDEARQTVAEAEQLLQASGAKDPWPGLFMVKGDIFARLDQVAQAEAAFLHEIRSYPRSPGPYGRLAFLYVAQGRPDAAVATLRRLVESNPDSPAAYMTAVGTLRILGDPQGAGALLREARRRFPEHNGLRQLEGRQARS